jgi:guanine nucleotide-binding protein subunit alpha
MGGCVSTADRAGKARSDEIDRQIEEDNRRFKRECKILLLGESSSFSFSSTFDSSAFWLL